MVSDFSKINNSFLNDLNINLNCKLEMFYDNLSSCVNHQGLTKPSGLSGWSQLEWVRLGWSRLEWVEWVKWVGVSEWVVVRILGHILFVPSLFSRLSYVFGRLQNPVLLVLSSKNGRFRKPSKPSDSLAGRLCKL